MSKNKAKCEHDRLYKSVVGNWCHCRDCGRYWRELIEPIKPENMGQCDNCERGATIKLHDGLCLCRDCYDHREVIITKSLALHHGYIDPDSKQ